MKNNFDFLQLERWDAIDEESLSDKDIKLLADKNCYFLCSNQEIAQFMSHMSLWEHIVKKEEDKVLVLEDAILPIDYFKKEFAERWKDVPDDFDIVFLSSGISYKNPIGTHVHRITGDENFMGYVVSKKGAQNLIDNIKLSLKPLQEIKHKIEGFAISPQLIYKNTTILPTRLIIENHPTFSKYFEKFTTHKNLFSDNYCHIRRLNFNLSNFIILLTLFSFFIGLLGRTVGIVYMIILMVLFGAELILTGNSFDYIKFKSLLLELYVVIFSLYIGVCLNSFMISS